MKTIKHIFVVSIAIIGITFSSCSEDDFKPLNDGEVQFSFQSPAPDQGRIESGSTPAKVIITIEDAAGTAVYTAEELLLVEFSGSYVTDPLTLSPGNYKVTAFLVTNASEETIYAAPLSGSDVAYLVSMPLAIDFTIVADQVTSIAPEVVSTALLSAADFGYASITFTTIETFDMLVSAMKYDGVLTGWQLTDATVSITGDGSPIYSKNIASETTQLKLNDGYVNYSISVSKPGFITNTASYTQAEMKAFFDDPLVVQLTAE
ncbi:hypothetical protein [Ekhidna sp.]|uniref:hypothetical protein n=1 Tax=Ekhidna sp. TaxID=2608089 RepID=UPI0032EF80BF